MRIKHQLAIFNVLTRLLIIVVLWFALPVLIKNVVYNHIDKSILEKKKKFIEHLDSKEISEFITRSDTSETYVSFSNLHNEFLQLYQSKNNSSKYKSIFKEEERVIENEQNEYRILYYNFNYENKDYVLEIGNNLSEIKDLTYTIRLFTSLLLLIVVSITFLADTFLIEYLFKPFYKIINTKIKFVDEPNSFNYEKVYSHSSEFDELDLGLNQMMYRIQELFQKEKQFIANVSHELLTPIALLKNRFENLLQNQSLNDEAVDKVASSMKTLDLLKKIINNLLLISRIDNNQYSLKEPVFIKEIVNEIIENFEDRLLEKNIQIKNQLAENFTFSGNKTLIHILIYNLVLNAIKYNIENGSVTISDSLKYDFYCISISDTGKGMTAEQQSKIFERFTRIDVDQEGQGLGLAIVDSIANYHHIKINVNSNIGEGSVFELSFPK